MIPFDVIRKTPIHAKHFFVLFQELASLRNAKELAPTSHHGFLYVGDCETGSLTKVCPDITVNTQIRRRTELPTVFVFKIFSE